MGKKEYLAYLPDIEERLHYFDEIDSTNILGKSLLREGKVGHIVVSAMQSAGRGRLDRSFSSPAGWGLYLSYLFPHMDLPATPTVYAGTLVAQTLTELYGEQFSIKWVNDILLGEKKICGILAEATPEGIVMGIGINLNTPMAYFGEDLPNAGSVGGILGIDCKVEQVGATLIEKLDTLSRCHGDRAYIGALFAYYKQHLATLGRQVRGTALTETFVGTAVDLLPDGTLIVRTTAGEERKVSFGDVHIRGINGYL